MRLSALLEGIKTGGLSADPQICGVTCDSRQVEKGYLFVAISGGQQDGHRFAGEALKRGAAVILAEHPPETGETAVITSDTRAAYTKICANFFHHPEKDMRFLAVTGTNGKTSTTQFVKAMLDGLGVKAGLLGTVYNQIGSQIFPASFTTPEPYQLYSILAQMRNEGVQTVVMEVSSQAMDQRRADGLPFKVAGFTNLTQDHLDYHGTMENYREAKARLFELSEKKIFNLDDETGRMFYHRFGGMTYSIKDRRADLFADEIEMDVTGVSCRIQKRDETARIHLSTPGLFTVHNALLAAGILLEEGYSFRQVTEQLSKIPSVPGRAEVITRGLPFTVMLDYAHTPDALENILTTIKHYAKGRVVTLFGCGGDRDRSKRPKMAAAVAQYSDFIIVTSDNPRTEDPAAIIQDILPGLTGSNVPYAVVENRKEAIGYAIHHAQENDIILLAGKGHEDYQILKTGKIRFDEKEIVKEFLEQE